MKSVSSKDEGVAGGKTGIGPMRVEHCDEAGGGLGCDWEWKGVPGRVDDWGVVS